MIFYMITLGEKPWSISTTKDLVRSSLSAFFAGLTIKSEPAAKKQIPHTLSPCYPPRDKAYPENKVAGERQTDNVPGFIWLLIKFFCIHVTIFFFH